MTDTTINHETLPELVAARKAQDRTLAVHVTGDPGADPPEGRALAVRVAFLLKGDEASIFDIATDGYPDDPPPGSVLLLTVEAADSRESWGQYQTIRNAISIRRLEQLHAVVHSEAIPARLESLVDARVFSDGRDPVRLDPNPYDGEVVEVQLAGLASQDGGYNERDR